MSLLVVILIVIILFASGFYLGIKFLGQRHSLNQVEYRRQWQKISDYMKNSDNYSLAIIEADKLLDQALKDHHFQGQTMAERLAEAGKYLTDKNSVWKAHKLRNRVVHELNVKLTQRQTKIVLKIFRQALKDMGAL